MRGPAALVLLLAATLLAFGGIYAWALPGVLAGALLLALIAPRAPDARAPEARAVDIALLLFAGAIAAQLVPLPPTVRALLSPHAAALESRIWPDAVLRTEGWRPLSLDPSGTVQALALVAAVVLTYRAARAIFSRGGVRFVCRALAALGATIAIEAIVQRAISPNLVYGVWSPRDPGAQPFGPVVNRNHLAGWLVMASALVAGYLLAQLAARVDRREPLLRVAARIVQSSAMWTATAWLAMAIAVAASRSRSGLIALGVALVGTVRSRSTRWAGMLVVVAGAALILGGALGPSGTVARFADVAETSDVSRVVIWEESASLARAFWLTGTGAGAFSSAMAGWQRASPYAPHLGATRHFNHAHNHYLQLAAEGGLLLLVPAVAALVLFLRLASRQMASTRGEMRAVRAGALAGLAAIAVQSIWEVPLTMPASALLAATLAAVATYERAREPDPARAPGVTSGRPASHDRMAAPAGSETA